MYGFGRRFHMKSRAAHWSGKSWRWSPRARNFGTMNAKETLFVDGIGGIVVGKAGGEAGSRHKSEQARRGGQEEALADLLSWSMLVPR